MGPMHYFFLYFSVTDKTTTETIDNQDKDSSDGQDIGTGIYKPYLVFSICNMET